MEVVSSAAIDQDVVLERVPCPMGCPPSDEHVLTGRDRINNLPGEFDIVRCGACGLMRTSPRPTADTIGFYYPPNYGPYVSTRPEMPGTGGVRGIKTRIVAMGRKIFDIKAHHIPRISPGRMLEIGCASGSYLQKMAAEGWKVEGIEFSPEAASTARELGFHVDAGAVETIEKPDGYYDLIVAWMVIEHLHDPVGSLRKLARWAKPGGKLVISVPDAGAAEFRLFGSRWYALHLPNHLTHFDQPTLKKLLEASGWRVVKVTHHRTMANAIGSAGYWAYDHGYRRIGQWMIDFPERGGRLGALVLYPIALIMAAMGQTGRMTVWAERKPQ